MISQKDPASERSTNYACQGEWSAKRRERRGGMFLIGIGENRDLWPRWRLRVRDFLNTKQCLCVTSVILVGKSNSHRHSRAIANGGGGGQGGICPPSTCCVKQIESVDGFFFSVDSVILVIVIVVRSLSAKYRPDRYRRDKSVKFGTELP